MPDSTKVFLERVKENEKKKIQERLKNVVPMRTTKDDWAQYNKADKCHICKKTINKKPKEELNKELAKPPLEDKSEITAILPTNFVGLHKTNAISTSNLSM